MFFRGGVGRLFVQHGWVELGDRTVVDPTRWTLDGKDPYIYVGPDDDYDVGGNQLRSAMRGDPPDFDESERVLSAPLALGGVFGVLLECPTRLAKAVTRSQLFWLANSPPADFGTSVKAFYEFLASQGLRALVPIDNWGLVMEEDE